MEPRLCGRRRESLQLMCISVDGFEEEVSHGLDFRRGPAVPG